MREGDKLQQTEPNTEVLYIQVTQLARISPSHHSTRVISRGSDTGENTQHKPTRTQPVQARTNTHTESVGKRTCAPPHGVRHPNRLTMNDSDAAAATATAGASAPRPPAEAADARRCLSVTAGGERRPAVLLSPNNEPH